MNRLSALIPLSTTPHLKAARNLLLSLFPSRPGRTKCTLLKLVMLLLFTHLLIVGTLILASTLYLHRALSPTFVIAASASFGALLLLAGVVWAWRCVRCGEGRRGKGIWGWRMGRVKGGEGIRDLERAIRSEEDKSDDGVDYRRGFWYGRRDREKGKKHTMSGARGDTRGQQRTRDLGISDPILKPRSTMNPYGLGMQDDTITQQPEQPALQEARGDVVSECQCHQHTTAEGADLRVDQENVRRQHLAETIDRRMAVSRSSYMSPKRSSFELSATPPTPPKRDTGAAISDTPRAGEYTPYRPPPAPARARTSNSGVVTPDTRAMRIHPISYLKLPTPVPAEPLTLDEEYQRIAQEEHLGTKPADQYRAPTPPEGSARAEVGSPRQGLRRVGRMRALNRRTVPFPDLLSEVWRPREREGL